MKNIKGKIEDLKLFDDNGKLVYEFAVYVDEYACEYIYDENGNVLTYKDSNGYSYEYAYDKNGKALTYKNSNGYSEEYTYDENGKVLTYKDSKGFSRGFNIPEFTMEKLVEKLGNFKLVK